MQVRLYQQWCCALGEYNVGLPIRKIYIFYALTLANHTTGQGLGSAVIWDQPYCLHILWKRLIEECLSPRCFLTRSCNGSSHAFQCLKLHSQNQSHNLLLNSNMPGDATILGTVTCQFHILEHWLHTVAVQYATCTGINESINQSIYLSIYLSEYLSIYLSIYLSTGTCACACLCIDIFEAVVGYQLLLNVNALMLPKLLSWW